MFKIRRDDIVKVIAGKDLGKTGKVMQVSAAHSRAIVEGINLSKKHMRRRQQEQKSGIVQVEKPMHISNLMLICKHCNKPTRAGFSLMKDKTKARICKKCKQVL